MRDDRVLDIRRTILEANSTLYYINESDSLDHIFLEKLNLLLDVNISI